MAIPKGSLEDFLGSGFSCSDLQKKRSAKQKLKVSQRQQLWMDVVSLISTLCRKQQQGNYAETDTNHGKIEPGRSKLRQNVIFVNVVHPLQLFSVHTSIHTPGFITTCTPILRMLGHSLVYSVTFWWRAASSFAILADDSYGWQREFLVQVKWLKVEHLNKSHGNSLHNLINMHNIITKILYRNIVSFGHNCSTSVCQNFTGNISNCVTKSIFNR